MNAIALNRLNGWQRLWLLVTVLWLPGAGFVTSAYFPTEAQWRGAALLQEYALMQEGDAEVKRVDAHCRDMPTEELVKSFKCYEATAQERRNVQTSYRESRARLRENLEQRISEELPYEQVKAIGKGIAIWLVPVILLYILGMGVAWVRKGFSTGV